jgi:hypothetical protein
MAIIRRVREDERNAIYTIVSAAPEAHRDVIRPIDPLALSRGMSTRTCGRQAAPIASLR